MRILAFVPATGSAQREPVALLCREVKPEPAAEADRFFVHLDFDEKVIRFHRRDLPMAKMLMIGEQQALLRLLKQTAAERRLRIHPNLTIVTASC